MERDFESIGNSLFLCVFGIGLFFWGFTRFRRKRLIENIPTSTVRSLAMGLVELVGKAKKKIDLKSPFKGAGCVFYKYLIERYQKRGRSGGSWVTVAKGDSSDCPFYLNDETGTVLVSPKGAEIIIPNDYGFTTGWGKTLPANLITFMEKYNLKYRSLFGMHTLRFTEWFICPDETIYILGTAKKSRDFLNDYNEKLIERLQELKENSNKMSEIDLNKDGEISMEEWDLARVKIEQELLETELKSSPASELADVVIGKGDTEKIFIISDHSQKDLTKKLFWQSISGIYVGAALALAMLLSLLIELGVLRFK